MPVYVYRNLVSGETFEVQQRMTDDALTVDPKTGDPVRRVIQPVGIAFKGSGFYVTDSRSSNAGASSATAPAGAAADGGSASGEASSDTGKPATDTAAPAAAAASTPAPAAPASTARPAASSAD